jgi:hypothetical protein
MLRAAPCQKKMQLRVYRVLRIAYYFEITLIMKFAIASLFAAAFAAPEATTADPAALINSCQMCIFEGFKFCQPNSALSSATSTCLTANQVCPSGTNEQTSFSQCTNN